MEKYIQAALVLFLLSMVSERLADFLKHYLSENNNGFGRWLRGVLRMGNLVSKAAQDSVQEDRRYYRILKINIICGFVIAAGLNADLFDLFEENKNALGSFGTGYKDVPDFIRSLPGCLATGLFLSFGSKFWHDLLDILFQIKNYRRVLADPATGRADNLGAIISATEAYESEFINAAYAQARPGLLSNQNVSSIALKHDGEGYYFELTLKLADPTIPNFYEYRLATGGVRSIRMMKTVDAEPVKIHALHLSDEICNTEKRSRKGTIGCLVRKLRDSRICVLTCFHNVSDPDRNFVFSENDANEVELLGGSEVLKGKLVEGIRDHEIDAALVELDAAVRRKVRNEVPGVGRVSGKRDIDTINIKEGIRVFMNGASSGAVEGRIVGKSDVTVEYPDGNKLLYNLLTLQKDGKGMAKEGDSGACILDDDDRIVGILVAGKSSVSYAIPASVVFSRLKIEPFTT
jgi:hypothetical protein